ncbi:uncharacterized protein SPPG_04736 [Spizellomyces punctatus DAOM BR117]|uniref:G-protein coupled receptors family 3 profile domain-containing protein n=1 Tax=Spizellomyces punctatus (strain DAOM BR117) TaxID=645134 RepID=A0A0L0HH19_SPIPD|nr:uncharacterized protein SPPG_04736 [Spizellomyces punctatus DAOM BR117]KND00413.1 hypothetical protein SPPG_04736 [Spizellomyces punctatus DAOM BR117]|eukprot:XP_016608452.1 hypothetical protein SPPG_04736 [Spizellomyces punctatus DAOM BR117]
MSHNLLSTLLCILHLIGTACASAVRAPWLTYRGLFENGTIMQDDNGTSEPYIRGPTPFPIPPVQFPLPIIGPHPASRLTLPGKGGLLRVGVSVQPASCDNSSDLYAPKTCQTFMWTKAASLLAETEINNNPNLLPDSKLEVIFLDNSNSDLTLKQTVTGLTQAQLSFVIGAVNDQDTVTSAAFSTAFQFSQGSAFFDNPSCPSGSEFFWLMTSGTERYKNLIKVAGLFNWTNIGIVRAQDPGAYLASQAILDAASETCIQVNTGLSLRWSKGTSAQCYCEDCAVLFNMTTCMRELGPAMNELKDSNLRVFYLLHGNHGSYVPLLILHCQAINVLDNVTMIQTFGEDFLAQSRGLITVEEDATQYDNDPLLQPAMLTHLKGRWDAYIDENSDRWSDRYAIKELSLIPRTFYDMIYSFANAADLVLNRDNLTILDWYDKELHKSLTLQVWNSTGYEGTTGKIVLSSRGDRLLHTNIYQFDGAAWDSQSYFSARALPVIGSIDMQKATLKAAPTWYGNRQTVPLDHVVLVRDQITIQNATGAVFTTLYSVTIAICIVSLALILWKRTDKVMVKRSPVFCVNILIGLVSMLSTIYVNVVDISPQTCTIERWTQSVGFALVMANVAAKAWRIWRIFDNADFQTIAMPNRELYKISGAILLITLLLLILWTGLDYPIVVLQTTPTTYIRICGSANITRSYVLASLVNGFNVILLLINAVLAWKTRNAPTDFGEAKQIAYTICWTIILSLMLVPYAYFTRNNTAFERFVFRFSLLWVMVAVIWTLLIGTHLYMVFLASEDGGGGIKGLSGIMHSDLYIEQNDMEIKSMAEAPMAKYLAGSFTFRKTSNFFSVWKKCHLQISTVPPSSLVIHYDLDPKDVPRSHQVILASDICEVFVVEEAPKRFAIQTAKAGRFIFQTPSEEKAMNWMYIVASIVATSTPRATPLGSKKTSKTKRKSTIA